LLQCLLADRLIHSILELQQVQHFQEYRMNLEDRVIQRLLKHLAFHHCPLDLQSLELR